MQIRFYMVDDIMTLLIEVTKAAVTKLVGYPILKPDQLEVMVAFLSGKDVFAVLPTGYGKRLCYHPFLLLFMRLSIIDLQRLRTKSFLCSAYQLYHHNHTNNTIIKVCHHLVTCVMRMSCINEATNNVKNQIPWNKSMHYVSPDPLASGRGWLHQTTTQHHFPGYNNYNYIVEQADK